MYITLHVWLRRGVSVHPLPCASAYLCGSWCGLSGGKICHIPCHNRRKYRGDAWWGTGVRLLLPKTAECYCTVPGQGWQRGSWSVSGWWSQTTWCSRSLRMTSCCFRSRPTWDETCRVGRWGSPPPSSYWPPLTGASPAPPCPRSTRLAPRQEGPEEGPEPHQTPGWVDGGRDRWISTPDTQRPDNPNRRTTFF